MKVNRKSSVKERNKIEDEERDKGNIVVIEQCK
jgi:hypothetical protein